MPAYINKFRAPTFTEETIVDKNGRVVGVIRVKPSRVLWKPSGQKKFYSVSLDAFIQWITDADTKATRTQS